MRTRSSLSFLSFFVLLLAACGGKNTTTTSTDSIKDTLDKSISKTEPALVAADSSLSGARTLIGQELGPWMRSFTNFYIDSFRLSQRTDFGTEAYQEISDLSSFYPLYKASLNFSPDSSQFIDIHSSGIMLEKKGKKLIASGDVDQAITYCNLVTKSWHRVAFFGPSAWIEEAVWTSPTTFLLAGVMVNDDGNQQAFIMQGDTNSRTFRWFESNSVRSQSVKYESSGIARLKIDEWE